MHGQAQFRHGKLKVAAKELKKNLDVKIVPIAIGDNAFEDDLREISSKANRIISCGVYQDPSTLAHSLLRGGIIYLFIYLLIYLFIYLFIYLLFISIIYTSLDYAVQVG